MVEPVPGDLVAKTGPGVGRHSRPILKLIKHIGQRRPTKFHFGDTNGNPRLEFDDPKILLLRQGADDVVPQSATRVRLTVHGRLVLVGENTHAIIGLSASPVHIGHRLSADPPPLSFLAFVRESNMQNPRDSLIISKGAQQPGILRRVIDRHQVTAQADGLCFRIRPVRGSKQLIQVPICGVGHRAGQHLRVKVGRPQADNQGRKLTGGFHSFDGLLGFSIENPARSVQRMDACIP